MLALTIALVVAFCIGLLISLTSMNQKVKELEAEKYTDRQIIDQLEAQVEFCYSNSFTLARMALYADNSVWSDQTTLTQRMLKRQAARILGKKIKVPDEDHPISFP